jgi:hypothetical protein
MGYTIQALIGDRVLLEEAGMPDVVVLPQGKAMIPLTEKYLDENNIRGLPFTDEGLTKIPDTLKSIGDQTSEKGRVVYIEAEFFGGQGMQASILWNHGAIFQGPIVSLNAINEALKFIEVEKDKDKDEFDSIGLGEHRSTEEWKSTNEA